MKKFTVLLLAAMLALSTACNPPVENPAETTAATETTTSAPTEAATTDIPETTTVTVATPEETTTVPTTEAPVTTVSDVPETTPELCETTTLPNGESPIIHVTMPPPPEGLQTAPGVEPGCETTPYIPSEVSLRWKYSYYADKKDYGYNDEIRITVENNGDEPFDVESIGLEAGFSVNKSTVNLTKGNKTEVVTTIPQLFGYCKIISGEYLIKCHISQPGGLSYKDLYLPITVDAGEWDNLIVSHKHENPYNASAPYPYAGKDVTFTLTNEGDTKVTINNDLWLEICTYNHNDRTRTWSPETKIPYNGKTELAPGESTQFVLPYDCETLSNFFGRLVVNFTTEKGGEYKAYTMLNITKPIEPGDDIPMAKKPVIYLYPEEKTNVSVQVELDGKLTCTYPDYGNGWNVTAYPDGRIINHADGLEYSYLYWEGESDTQWDMSEGYVVKGEDTAKFLQKILSEMGLTPKEYNEFIVYWLPRMQNNKYNLITFQQKVYENTAKLKINPTPDSILRIFMVFQPLDEPITVTAPTIKPFERKGFTVVEWGGGGSLR